MINKLIGHIKITLLIFDLLLLNLSLYIAPILISEFNNLCLSTNYFSQVFFLNSLWVLITYFKKSYDNFLFTESTVLIHCAYKTSIEFLMFAGFFFFILSLNDYAKSCTFILFILISLIFSGMIVLERIFVLSIRKKYRNKIIPQCNVVLLGKQRVIEKVYKSLNGNAFIYNIVGTFSHVCEENIHPLYKGNFNDLLDFLPANNVHEIYCDYNNLSSGEMQKLLSETDKRMIRLRFLFDYPDVINKNAKITTGFGDFPVMTIRSEPLQEEFNQFIKRAFDIIFSSIVILFVLSWLIPILALIIKSESKGPVFFKQIRSGKNNKPFLCYKFRSMHVNVVSDEKQATIDDVRFTKIGKFLRRTSLDELPQFFNVLKNDMSVIGPRPHMTAHTEKYKRLLENYMIRHFLKPGITGWAQINGFRGETKLLSEMEKRVQHDMYYLENWSLSFDFKIMFLTIGLLLKKDAKAY